MAHLILKEIEQDPFNVDNLIENLTYKATDGRVGQASFDPLILEEIFKRTIEDLKKINDKSKQKIESLEAECQKEMASCKDKIGKLEGLYQDSFDELTQLDKRISTVAGTMSDMGSQLENLNKPRLNLYESHKIAKYFDKFMEGSHQSGVFADDSKLEQAAEVILKLNQVASDLKDERFEDTNALIEGKYNEIEAQLINSFQQAYFRNDRKEMKKYLNILSNFRGYQNCINEFIKNLQLSVQNARDLFKEIVPLCKKTNEIINEVFSNNERIMEQFIKDLFLTRVQVYVNTSIEQYRETDLEKYLDTIYMYYNKNKKIFREIADIMKISAESTFFTKLMNDVYQGHLRDYANFEKFNLQNKLKAHSDRFYDQINHTKRNPQSGFVSNLLSKSSNEVIDENFLSYDVTTLCIDDAKKAIERIKVLSDPNSQPKVIEEIYDMLSNCLCREHFAYALDLHINAQQNIDVKQEPSLHTFPMVKKLTDLMYLYEQFTTTTVLPAVNSTTQHSRIANKLKQSCADLELKLDIALEKALNAICNHLKHVLTTEQKKSDFKSESEDLSNQRTPACSRVLKISEGFIGKIGGNLDGKNVNNVLKELGIKFHRCIYDHLFRFEYNEQGAMALIRDINEYRLFAKNFNSQVVDKLFSVLYSLCNLLIVQPANLNEIASGDSLIMLSKDTIESFIQLRADAKTLKYQLVRAK